MDPDTFFEQYDDRIEKTEDCWLWTGATSSNGYGNFTRNKQVFAAHRAALGLPDGYVLHHCDVKNCVNPDHLYVGDQSDNMQDSFERGTHDFSGENHNQTDLTREEVEELREEYETSDKSQFELADEYGISQPNVSRIVNNRTWN
jgi:predicted XRE-type DNA-binding protein